MKEHILYQQKYIFAYILNDYPLKITQILC